MNELDKIIYEKYQDNVKGYYFLRGINKLRFIIRENKKILQQHRVIHVDFIKPQWIAGNYFDNDCFDIWLDVPLVEEE